jgi:hypothetical protein
MVVQTVDEEKKVVTTVWFTSGNVYQEVYQEGTFPAGALDRVEAKKPPKSQKSPKKR